MKKIQVIIILLFATMHLQAQSIKCSVIGSAGKSMNSSPYKLRSTVGEAIVKKSNGTGLKLGQGFHKGVKTSIALPIIGLEFFAKRINNTQVNLQWKTLAEMNSKGFYIERKYENENVYSPIYFQSSLVVNGNSSTSLEYSYHDQNTYQGTTYYRLKQVDIDGKFHYSVVRVVHGESVSNVRMEVWPIPAHDHINITLNGIQKNEVVELVDMSGKIICSVSMMNQSQRQFNLNGLTSGIYLVRMNGDENLVQKIVIE